MIFKMLIPSVLHSKTLNYCNTLGTPVLSIGDSYLEVIYYKRMQNKLYLSEKG